MSLLELGRGSRRTSRVENKMRCKRNTTRTKRTMACKNVRNARLHAEFCFRKIRAAASIRKKIDRFFDRFTILIDRRTVIAVEDFKSMRPDIKRKRN